MAINVEEALEKILTNTSFNKTEIIPIESSTNRVISQNIFAKLFLPRFNNSAMDGYAILFKDKGKKVKVTDTIFAGDNNQKELKPNTTFKIMTGAKIPDNCEAVVPKEHTKEISEDEIELPQDIREFQHIRYVGEDIKNGELLIAKGKELNFADITLLSSQGITHIEVYRKPKVVVFSSGEELKLHYEKVEDFQIYNSNTPTFIARVKELGCDVSFVGGAKDSIESIKEFIKNSLDADLIITSGGVSVGDADFTRAAFDELGFEEIFCGIIVKPGKPTMFGKINSTYILNLPGNPLASAMIFEFFGRILIQKLIGSKDIYHNTIKGKIKDSLQNKKGRVTLVPGFFDGEYFEASSKRSPGMVNILAHCNSLIALDKNVDCLEKESIINILPINWKFFNEEKKDYLTI